jgi:hypothetical protein
MAGLLNLVDDPSSQGLLSLGLRLMSTPGNFGTALGQSGLGALGDLNAAAQAKQRRDLLAQEESARAMQMRMQQQQMQQMMEAQARQKAIEEAYRGAMRSPEQQAMQQFGGPTVAAANAAPGMAPAFDQQALIRGLTQADPMAAYQMMQPKPADYKVVGDALVSVGPQGVKEAYRAPAKPEAAPTAVQEYNFAKAQGYGGTFEQWKKSNAQAGATQIGMPRIEVKTGEGLAGQIGPMAKDSQTKVQGAVGMYDSADRIQRAIDSGKVSAGPFTTQIQTVKQLIQKVGGGNDEGIRQTRQVMKSLAQMAVEARKELAGQGQVTENEAAAVARAEAGDINELTVGELQDLVTLTKRAAHYRAKSHQQIIDTMGQSDATKGLIPFYQVRGVERLLEHSPQLPQIGGPPKVMKFDADGNQIK